MEKMPVFIKIESYNDVLDLMKMIKDKTEKAKELLLKINDLKIEEDRKIAMWKNNLLDVDTKLKELDQRLFEPDN